MNVYHPGGESKRACPRFYSLFKNRGERLHLEPNKQVGLSYFSKSSPCLLERERERERKKEGKRGKMDFLRET